MLSSFRHPPALLLLASLGLHAQTRDVAASLDNGKGVPSEFTGNWVCQTSVPGYNLPTPVITGQAPSTGRMTTPPSTVVIKFTLRADGTYEAANGSGHYSFRAADKTIDWLDGLHRQSFTNTKLSRRSNGAPSLSVIANRRYYGCFLSNAPGTSKPNSNEPVPKGAGSAGDAGSRRQPK
jgi:hypothetical protein